MANTEVFNPLGGEHGKGDFSFAGTTGPAGQGVPIGGSAGQALEKISGTDYDTAWVTIPPGAIIPTSLQTDLMITDHTQMLFCQHMLVGSRSILIGTDASLIGV